MKFNELLLQGVIDSFGKELLRNIAENERRKRAEELKNGSIDVEFKVIK
ncbi:MAG: hypothetical protein PHZ02_01310 [Desulfocapsaceae bacterium]|nr:hypothetical protein [Desulfocapsaceae bacterium]